MPNETEKLKSDVEWLAIALKTDATEKRNLELIQQIQLNAYKAGMRRAAGVSISLCTCKLKGIEEKDWCDRCQQNKHNADKILTLAETITEKEMI